MPDRLTCTRRLTFCAGHRVMGHENKCAHLHGHNYVVEVTAEGVRAAVDEIGRVIDFAVLKQRLGEWLEENWDHGFIIWDMDEAACAALVGLESHKSGGWRQKLYALPLNPTAENLAAYLLNNVCPVLFEHAGVMITKIVVHETENCSATAEKGTS